MPELARLQADFADALRGTQAVPVRGWLAGDDALVDRRLGIYRANVAANAVNAMSMAYPVVEQIVGHEFFGGLVRAYVREHPSTSGDLGELGGEFATFLAGFEHARSLPYLPAVARLEWAVHRAGSAADAPPWDPAALQGVPPDRQGAIRFAWAPGTALVDAACPVVRLWQLHQPGRDGDFSVDWQVRECALVAREGYRVAVSTVDAGEAAFVAASLDGQPLAEAAAAAIERHPAFDLGQFLARAFSAGLICGHSLQGPTP